MIKRDILKSIFIAELKVYDNHIFLNNHFCFTDNSERELLIDYAKTDASIDLNFAYDMTVTKIYIADYNIITIYFILGSVSLKHAIKIN